MAKDEAGTSVHLQHARCSRRSCGLRLCAWENAVVDDAIEASVRVSCPRCGIVEVSAERLRLRMSLAQTGDRRSVVEFRCHGCGDLHEQPVDERTSRLLAAAGVVLEVPAMHPHQRDHR
jgi:hypothetical protein